MRLARSAPVDGRQARMSRAWDTAELREQLSAAIADYDRHTIDANDLGRGPNTVAALKSIALANDAAKRAEELADKITALGEAARAASRVSDWVTSR